MKELSPLEVFDDVVARIARTVSIENPAVDYDDVSQALYLTILENRSQFKNPDHAGVTGALWKVARGFAHDQRVQGLHVSPQWCYSTEEIRSILEHTFTYEEWPETEVPELAVSRYPSADELDLQSDIKWAWEQLSLEDQRVIFEKYALKEDLGATKRQRLKRAIDRMAEVLNTYPRKGHARRAVSNTRAQHDIGGNYE